MSTEEKNEEILRKSFLPFNLNLFHLGYYWQFDSFELPDGPSPNSDLGFGFNFTDLGL